MKICLNFEGVARIHGKDDLYASHVRAWSKIWAQGRIDIKGNLALAQAAYGSWYYLLSSIPLRSNMLFVGLSPSGLPFGNTEKASCFSDELIPFCKRVVQYVLFIKFHNKV